MTQASKLTIIIRLTTGLWAVWPVKKSPNVYKSCPKIISLEKLNILTPFQKMPKNVGDLGKLIVAKGFEKLPKVQKSPNLVTLAMGVLKPQLITS